jgi:hypothetical protein
MERPYLKGGLSREQGATEQKITDVSTPTERQWNKARRQDHGTVHATAG